MIVPSPAENVFLSARGLHKQYQDASGKAMPVLKGLFLEVAKGESVAITGASGTGKSTLLHLLGLLDQPDQGDIRVNGALCHQLSPMQAAALRNETLGFVFQFHHLLMDFSVLENVMMPIWIHKGRRDDNSNRALQLLEQMKVGHCAHKKPAQLSGGERQRVAIARAIANHPPCILADEPTGSLDQGTGREVANLLLALNREEAITLVVVTHNMELAKQMSRHLVLEQGMLHDASNESGGTE